MSTQSTVYRTFGDLVDAHQVEVCRYLLRLTGNPAEADDLFQDTFLRALPVFDRLRAGSNHRAWVCRIATNAFLNHRCRRTRRREVPLPEELSPRRSSHAAPYDCRATAAICRYAILRLPPRQRAAFVQRNLHGLTYADIARAMGCSEAAARVNVYQAVKRMRRELINAEVQR